MKKLPIVIMLLLSGSLFGQGKYKTMFVGSVSGFSPPPSWTNLVSWWKMDETSGGTAADSEGTDHGTVVGATQTSSGVVFDGTNDSIIVGGTAFGTDDFSIFFRITPEDPTGDNIVIGGVPGSFSVRIYEGQVLYVDVNGTSSYIYSTDQLSRYNLNFISIVRTGSTWKLGVNGSVQTKTLAANFTEPFTSMGVANWYGKDFEGKLKDVCYFSDAKSDAWVTAFYNSGSYTEYEDGDPLGGTPTWTNLLHWYTLDEASGGTAADSYGSDDGTVTNATQGATGRIGNGVSFDGIGDYITLGTGETFNDQTWTFGAWVYPTTTEGVILGGVSGCMTIIYGWTTLRLRVMAEGGSGTSVTGLTMTQNAWNFISVTQDGTTFRFGVNGSYEDIVWDNYFVTASNTIGEGQEAVDFTGRLDEVVIFSDVKADAYLDAIRTGLKTYTDGE